MGTESGSAGLCAACRAELPGAWVGWKERIPLDAAPETCCTGLSTRRACPAGRPDRRETHLLEGCSREEAPMTC